jgi:hypothetical protein
MIKVNAREVSLLLGGVIGLLAGFQLTNDYQVAATISFAIVGGFFLVKWLTRLTSH